MIVDREEMDRKRAPAIAELQRLAGQEGRAGVMARLGLATTDIDVWAVDELRRGTPHAEIQIAMMQRAAAMVACQFACLGRGDEPGVVEARQALLCVFEQELIAAVRRLDTMSDAELAANSTTLHQAQ